MPVVLGGGASLFRGQATGRGAQQRGRTAEAPIPHWDWENQRLPLLGRSAGRRTPPPSRPFCPSYPKIRTAPIPRSRGVTTLSDGSTMQVDEEGVVCFPGKSFFAPGAQRSFGNPGTFEGMFTVTEGTGVFSGAEGTSSSRSEQPATRATPASRGPSRCPEGYEPDPPGPAPRRERDPGPARTAPVSPENVGDRGGCFPAVSLLGR